MFGGFKRKALRGVSKLLLVAYALLLFRPAMPVIVDGLAHAFWRNVHIAMVHKVNGVEHVHYELLKNAKDLEKEKGAAKSKVPVDDAPCYIEKLQPLSFKTSPQYLPPQNIMCEAVYADAYPAHDYPPPKA